MYSNFLLHRANTILQTIYMVSDFMIWLHVFFKISAFIIVSKDTNQVLVNAYMLEFNHSQSVSTFLRLS